MMLHKPVSTAAWGCLVFIAFASLTPLHSRPVLTESEPFAIVVFERIAAFAVLGFLFSVSYYRRYAFICVLVLGSAILLEVLQVFVPDRDARVLDAIEKMVGGTAGILVAHWLLSIVPAHIAALILPAGEAPHPDVNLTKMPPLF
jgi:VanZ family protein